MISRWKRFRAARPAPAAVAAIAALVAPLLPACAGSPARSEARSVLEQPWVREAPASPPRGSADGGGAGRSASPGERAAAGDDGDPAAAGAGDGALPATDAPYELTDEQLAGAIEVGAVVRAVVSRSPELRAHAHRVRALVASTFSAGRLPPPMAMVTLWRAPLHSPFVYGDGSMLMLGLQQTFPPGAALEAEARAAVEEAKAEAAMLSAREQGLAQQAARLFIDHAEAARRERLFESQRQLLVQLLETARARLSTGGTALQDVTRVQLAAAKLDGDAAMAAGDRARARAALNVLLGRPPGAALGEPRELGASAPDITPERAAARARERRGEVAAARAAERRESARSAGASAMARQPEFALGLSYGLMRQSGMPDNWGATFSMSLPWLSPAYGARSEAAAHAAAGARHAVDGQLLAIDRDVADALVRVDVSSRQLSILTGPARTAAARSIDAARAAYVGGGGDALGWIDALRGRLEVAVGELEARAALERAIVDLERAIGAPVPRRPLTDLPAAPLAAQEPRRGR
jgi:outer membrane protein, heavy metal efflux system